MSDEAKHLFISHANQGDTAFQDLKRFLSGHGYEIQDSTTDSSNVHEATNEQYIKSSILAPRIDRAGVMLVLISPVTRTRPWVDWEIEYAQQQGKRIVGMYVQGGTESNLPASFQLYGDALVGGQADRLMDAIEGRIDTMLMPDGKTELPERDIDRFDCGEPEPK